MRLFTVAVFLAATPLLAQDPMDARGWINRGVSEFKAANYTQAANSFQRAVQSDPANVTAHLYLATAWMQQYIPGVETLENRSFAEAATREFLKVLDMDSGNKEAMSSLASLELNQKKWDQAQAWYEKLVAADPGNANAWYSMGFIAWSRWYPAISQARISLGMKLQDPGPLPPSPIKEELKAKYGSVIEGGMRALQQGLLINPRFSDAMAYMNLLIRERADLRDSAEDYQRDVAEANAWVDKAMEAKKQEVQQHTGAQPMAPPPPPPPPPPPSGGAPGTPERIRISGDVQSASLVRKVDPVYPALAKSAGVSGAVTLSIVIGRDGTVTEMNFVNGPALLVEAAMDAVRQWVYKPTLLNGEPVQVLSTVTVNFQ